MYVHPEPYVEWYMYRLLNEWLLLWPLQLSWFKSYGAYESWLREQKGVVELSGCMDTTVGTGMFMYVNQGEEYALRLYWSYMLNDFWVIYSLLYM